MDTHTHYTIWSQEKLSIRKASLSLLVNLWFEKSCKQSKLKLKSRLHFIDITAYHFLEKNKEKNGTKNGNKNWMQKKETKKIK